MDKTKILPQTPLEHIDQREGRAGQTWSYVKVGYVLDQLDAVFGVGGWSWVKDEVIIMDGHVVYIGTLACRLGDRVLTISGEGAAHIKERSGGGGLQSLGNDVKAASSDALKTAARRLGIARDLSRVAGSQLREDILGFARSGALTIMELDVCFRLANPSLALNIMECRKANAIVFIDLDMKLMEPDARATIGECQVFATRKEKAEADDVPSQDR